MTKFKPFENDTQSWSAGEGDGLTLVNGTESIAMYGAVKLGAKNVDAAGELLDILTAMRSMMAPGEAPSILRAKKGRQTLTLEGDADVEKSTPAGALDEAVAALEAFRSGQPG